MVVLNFQEIIEKIDRLEEANIILAALKFDLFTYLGKAERTSQYVSRKAGLTLEGTIALLDALAAMGVLIKTKGKFKNSSESYKYLCKTSRHYKKGTVFLKKENRGEWSGLIDIIQNGRKEEDFDGDDDPEFRELFTHAMHERSEIFSEKLAKIITRKPVGKLVDLGGGPGSYSAEILKKDKKATALLIDRSASIKIAKKLLRNLPVYKRFKFLSGDLFETDYGKQNDTVLFSNILHIYDEKENSILLKVIKKSLKKGGRVVVVDLLLNSDRIKPYAAALFSLTMLMFTKTGKTYTFDETELLLKKTGFGKFKRFDLGEGSSVIEAEKL